MMTSTREPAQQGGRDHRNPWPASIGTGGRLRAESPADFVGMRTLRMCRRPAAARAAPAGRPLLHDRSVLRQARIADRICRRSCLHDCTPLYAASDVSDVLSPLTVACFRRAAPPGALRRLGGDPVLGIGLSPSTLLVRERRPVWRFILWSFTDEPRRNGGVVLKSLRAAITGSPSKKEGDDTLVRWPWLLAIGQGLQSEYAVLNKQPLPKRLAALLKKLTKSPRH